MDDYVNNAAMKQMFVNVARVIIDSFHPRSILDVGCACGHLVAAFHDLGVEAYGIDFSEYAIGQVRQDIRPFVATGSVSDALPDNFPKHFDMVFNIEVLEHIPPDDTAAALDRLCSYSDRIVFSSTPDDANEKTHINLHPMTFWFSQFAQRGYGTNFMNTGRLLNKQCFIFDKGISVNIMLLSMIERYWEMARERENLEGKLEKLNAKLNNA